MASEGRVSITLEYEDSREIPVAFQKLLKEFNVSDKHYNIAQVSVGITEEAVPLGEATSPGFAGFMNLDETNYVTLLSGTGGLAIGKLLPGEPACWRLGADMQAPFWIANSLACDCLVLIINT